MIEEIRAGQDQHAFTCVNLMELPLTKDNRTDAKIFNFRAIYADLDSAAYAYYMDHKMPAFSQKKWDTIIQNFAEKYKGMVDAHAQWVKEVRDKGCIIGPTGRKWIFQKEQKRGYWEYSKAKVYNYPVQGTSGDIMKIALIVIRKRLMRECPTVKMCITVHDSLIFDGPTEEDCRKAAKIAIDTFQEIPQLTKKFFGFEINLPISGEADLGNTWGTVERII